MQSLESENLISGVIHAETPSQNVTPSSSSEHNGHVDTCPDSLEKIVSEVFDKTVARFEDKIIEAEQRGFQRAVELARQNPESLGISQSVPNFLADVRPDMWDN